MEKLTASKQEFQRVTAYGQRPPNSEIGHVSRDSCQTGLKDLSAREIEDIAEKAAKEIKRLSGGVKAIDINTDSILAFSYILGQNVSDVVELKE